MSQQRAKHKAIAHLPKGKIKPSSGKAVKKPPSIAEKVEKDPHICDSPHFFASEKTQQKTILFSKAAMYVLEVKKSLSPKEVSKFVSDAVVDYGLRTIPHKHFNETFLSAYPVVTFENVYPIAKVLTALALRSLRERDDFLKMVQFVNEKFEKMKAMRSPDALAKKASELYNKLNAKEKGIDDAEQSSKREEDRYLWIALIHAKHLGWLEEKTEEHDD